jgi:hypothetical protein
MNRNDRKRLLRIVLSSRKPASPHVHPPYSGMSLICDEPPSCIDKERQVLICHVMMCLPCARCFSAHLTKCLTDNRALAGRRLKQCLHGYGVQYCTRAVISDQRSAGFVSVFQLKTTLQLACPRRKCKHQGLRIWGTNFSRKILTF